MSVNLHVPRRAHPGKRELGCIPWWTVRDQGERPTQKVDSLEESVG